MMKSWTGLVLVSSIIIASAFFTGCADSDNGGKKPTKEPRGKNQIQITVNKLKKYKCHLSDDVSKFKEKSTVSCTGFNDLTEVKKKEAIALLKELKNTSNTYAVNTKLNNTERDLYQLVADATQNEISRLTDIVDGLSQKKLENLEAMEDELNKKLKAQITSVNDSVKGLDIKNNNNGLMQVVWSPSEASSESKDMDVLEKKAIALDRIVSFLKKDLTTFAERQDNSQFTLSVEGFQNSNAEGIVRLENYAKMFKMALSIEYMIEVDSVLDELNAALDIDELRICCSTNLTNPFSAQFSDGDLLSMRLEVYEQGINDDVDVFGDIDVIAGESLVITDDQLPIDLDQITIENGDKLATALKAAIEKLNNFEKPEGSFAKYEANMAFASELDAKRIKVIEFLQKKLNILSEKLVALQEAARQTDPADPGST